MTQCSLGPAPNPEIFWAWRAVINDVLHLKLPSDTINVRGKTDSGSAGTQLGKGYLGRWHCNGAGSLGESLVAENAFERPVGRRSSSLKKSISQLKGTSNLVFSFKNAVIC